MDGHACAEMSHRTSIAWNCFWDMRQWLLKRLLPLNAQLALWKLALDPNTLWAAGDFNLTLVEGPSYVDGEPNALRLCADTPSVG